MGVIRAITLNSPCACVRVPVGLGVGMGLCVWLLVGCVSVVWVVGVLVCSCAHCVYYYVGCQAVRGAGMRAGVRARAASCILAAQGRGGRRLRLQAAGDGWGGGDAEDDVIV
jgi:hypothetical protein